MYGKVNDPNGKERMLRSANRMHHMVDDVVNEGEQIEQTYLEVIIVGKNSEWKEWWVLDEFLEMNPDRKPQWKSD